MRFRVDFVSDSIIDLPRDYQAMIQGMLYHLLQEVPEYSSYLHDQGHSGESKRKYKAFTFSQLQGKYEITKNNSIRFPQGMSLWISSPDLMFCNILIRAFYRVPEFRIGRQMLHVKQLWVDDTHIRQDHVRVRMISPVTVNVTEPGTYYQRYISPLDDEWEALIAQNFKNKFEAITQFPVTSNIEVELCSVGERDRKMIRLKDGIKIIGWNGVFDIYGAPEYLDFLYQTGLGSHNSSGFGMFELVH